MLGLEVLKVSPEEFAEKGEEIYSGIGKELETGHQSNGLGRLYRRGWNTEG